jgi:integrase
MAPELVEIWSPSRWKKKISNGNQQVADVIQSPREISGAAVNSPHYSGTSGVHLPSDNDNLASSNPPAGTDQSARNPTIRVELSMGAIKRWRRDEPPVGYDASGKVVFGREPSRDSFIIWDAHADAPAGFGVKVAKRKTYIVRRKVAGNSITVKVGDVADFNSLDEARRKARELLQVIEETGRNPNRLLRERWEADLTVGRALERYRHHLVTRAQRPATKDTLKVHDRVAKRFEEWGWSKRRICDLGANEIEAKFLEHTVPHADANEQRFRWVISAVNWCIDAAKFEPLLPGQTPALTVNPFQILLHNRHFRSQAQIERVRQDRGVRNPLRTGHDLGPFLEAAWSKQWTNDNSTGVHYVLLALLWGCRRSEHAQLVWDEFLAGDGDKEFRRRTTSHVCLDPAVPLAPYVYFSQTKNGRSHRLPIPPLTLKLLEMRKAAAAEETMRRGFSAKARQYVFPARSRFSKTGHYADPTSLLEALREEIGVSRLTPHDLRRSFGAMLTHLNVAEAVKKRFLNHTASDVTDIYTRAEWDRLAEEMAKVEQAMFVRAPNVYNALKPAAWPPLSAPPPHVCRPPSPRSGRPRKGQASETGE